MQIETEFAFLLGTSYHILILILLSFIKLKKIIRESETMQCLENRRFSLLCLWIFLFKNMLTKKCIPFFTSIDPLCYYYCCNRDTVCLKSQGLSFQIKILTNGLQLIFVLAWNIKLFLHSCSDDVLFAYFFCKRLTNLPNKIR